MENENMRRQYLVIGRYPINQYTLFLSAGLGDLFQSVSIFSQSYSSLAIIQKIVDNDGRSKLRYVDATCTDSRAKRANRQKMTFCKTKTQTWNFRQPIAVSDISIYICLINIRSKSKEQLNERRAGLSNEEPTR